MPIIAIVQVVGFVGGEVLSDRDLPTVCKLLQQLLPTVVPKVAFRMDEMLRRGNGLPDAT